MPEAVVQEGYHIDRTKLLVTVTLRQFQVVESRGVVDAPLEEPVLGVRLHLHDERPACLVNADQIQDGLLAVDDVPPLLTVGIFHNVLHPRLGREDLVQHPDEDVLVLAVGQHRLEASVAPKVHERSELLQFLIDT